MIPAPFDYERPNSLDAALAALAGFVAEGTSVRALAGGQSLLPLMKLRLARPERLVDIGRFGDLRGVRRLEGGGLAIGALTTWSALLDDADVTAWGVLGDAIPTIGDVQVRNRGTIAGSLAHADPASDIAAAILALEATLEIRSVRGTRTVAAADLYVGPFATTLAPDELITEIRLPAPSPGTGSAYVAVQHPASGYPVAGVAAIVSQSGDRCSIGVTGVGEMPYRATAAERAILDGAPPQVAAARTADDQRVLSDPYADREYRAAMAEVVARRAVEQAIARAADRDAV